MSLRFTIFLTLMPMFIYGQNYFYTKNTELPCVNKNFSVYFHVVLDSLQKDPVGPDKIAEYVAKINRAFRPICISFTECQTDFIKDYSFEKLGTSKKISLMTNVWQKHNFINIYVVKNVGISNSFSEFYGISEKENGVIIIPRSGVGLEHELGNLFGLLHTFETRYGVEKVDGSNCKDAGDKICDTPADPYLISKGIFNYVDRNTCEFNFSGKDINNEFYLTEVGNYMTHYFCAHCFFSQEQYKKMAKNYFDSPFKMW